MAVIQRPAKQGNATTYQGKVAQGYTGILAAEVDADLDVIYAAWNGGVDTVNIAAGSITADKIAPNQIGTRELADLGVATGDLANLAVTTPKLADGAVTLAKLGPDAKLWTTSGNAVVPFDTNKAVSVPNTAFPQFLFGGKGAIACDTLPVVSLLLNNPWVLVDATKPSWVLQLSAQAASDVAQFVHRAANAASGTVTVPLWLDNAGNLTITGKLSGGAATGARQHVSPGGFSTSTYNTPVLVYTLPAITTRGGAVLLVMNHTLYYTSSATAGNGQIATLIFRNGTQITLHQQNYGSGGGQIVVPIPALTYLDTPPAGTYTYDLRVQLASTTSPSVVASGFGDCIAQEIG